MNEQERVYNKVDSIIRKKASSTYIGEDDFVSLRKGGIAIAFHLKNAGLDLENIYRAVKRAQKIVKGRFDYNLEQIDISIYESTAEMREEGLSRSRYGSWIAGIFDGRIRVIAERDDDAPESLYIILTHEIIHLAIYDIGKGRCPYWLDEGLAVYLSQELPDEYTEILCRAVKDERIWPMESLQRPLPTNLTDGLRKLAYAQVSDVVNYLIEKSGWNSVKNIIHHCANREINAILGDMSLNYYLIEQGWLRWRRSSNA